MVVDVKVLKHRLWGIRLAVINPKGPVNELNKWGISSFLLREKTSPRSKKKMVMDGDGKFCWEGI